MVLVPPRQLDWYQKNDGLGTLYISLDKGKVFSPAKVRMRTVRRRSRAVLFTLREGREMDYFISLLVALCVVSSQQSAVSMYLASRPVLCIVFLYHPLFG